MAVECDHKRAMSLESQREHPCIGGVDQSQSQPLTGAHRELVLHRTVDRECVADPPGVRHVKGVAEVFADVPRRRRAPVVEHPGHVAVDRMRIALLDDERALQAAILLLRALEVRVIPERAGIDRIELIDEPCARLDRVLREVRHAIHRIGQADAMPVNGGWLFQPVDHGHAQAIPLLDANLGAGDLAVVGPGGHGRASRIGQRFAAPCDELELSQGASPVRRRRRNGNRWNCNE